MKVYYNDRGFQLGNLLFVLMQAHKDRLAGIEESYVLRTGYFKFAQSFFPKTERQTREPERHSFFMLGKYPSVLVGISALHPKLPLIGSLSVRYEVTINRRFFHKLHMSSGALDTSFFKYHNFIRVFNRVQFMGYNYRRFIL